MTRSLLPPSLLRRIRDLENRVRVLGPVSTSYTDLDLQGAWTALGDEYAVPGFQRSRDGYVHLRGVATGGTSGSTLAVLPEGVRPEYCLRIAPSSAGASAPFMEIEPDGTIIVSGAGVGTWLSLDSVSFVAMTPPPTADLYAGE